MQVSIFIDFIDIFLVSQSWKSEWVFTAKSWRFEICDYMRLCCQGCTKTRLMLEKLALILTTYCIYCFLSNSGLRQNASFLLTVSANYRTRFFCNRTTYLSRLSGLRHHTFALKSSVFIWILSALQAAENSILNIVVSEHQGFYVWEFVWEKVSKTC